MFKIILVLVISFLVLIICASVVFSIMATMLSSDISREEERRILDEYFEEESRNDL